MKLFTYRYKSAITGRFVSEAYAKAHKSTTFRARIWFWQKAPDL